MESFSNPSHALNLKISVMMDISILKFYGYIRYVENISVDFFKISINKKLFKINLFVFIFYINISLS